MNLESIIHEIHLMFFRVLHGDSKTMYGSLLMLAVSFAFMIVGIARWVEILDFKFSKFRRYVLILMHVVGCIDLAAAFSLEALDLEKKFSNLGLGLLTSALLLLFPMHIYLGLLRRIRNRDDNRIAKQ